MDRDKIEKLGSLFIAIFSSGLALRLATDGMAPRQWAGALLAVIGSMALTLAVHAWPRPAEARVAARRRSDD